MSQKQQILGIFNNVPKSTKVTNFSHKIREIITKLERLDCLSNKQSTVSYHVGTET